MGVREFLVYVSCHLGKFVLPSLVPLIVAKLKEYWETPTKGWIDESMTAYANFMSLTCPGCKKMKWDPYPCDSKDEIQKNYLKDDSKK
jgi:hypothetical protein